MNRNLLTVLLVLLLWTLLMSLLVPVFLAPKLWLGSIVGLLIGLALIGIHVDKRMTR
jgi:uncharacterized membrane protein YczE